jgi:cell division protein ZapA (FtsZ GTPase activity inhibitor)
MTMPIVEVSIRGKRYPISCEAGQEDQLRAVAEKFDNRLGGLAEALPRAGDMAIMVIAGIMAEADARDRKNASIPMSAPPRAEDVAAREQAQKEAMRKVEEKALENANQTLSRAINGIADYVENVAKTLESV